MSNVQRRKSGVYECRHRLPKKLAGKAAPVFMRTEFADLINARTGGFKLEVSRSLNTSDPETAKRRGRKESAEIAERIEAAVAALSRRSSPGAAPDANELAAEVVKDLLGWDENEREGDDRRTLQLPSERPAGSNLVELKFRAGELGMEEDHHHVHGEELEEELRLYKRDLARRDTKAVEKDVARLLRRSGQSLPEDPEKRRALLIKTLEATVRGLEMALRRQVGEVVEVSLPSAEELGPKLTAAFGLWKRGGGAKGAKKPNANSIVETENIIRRFTEFHGDLRLGVITKAHAREFRDAIAKVPSRLPRKLQSVPIKELLRRDLAEYPLRAATTINKQLQLLSAIVSHAQREGLLDTVPGFVNPFDKDVKLRIDPREIEERVVFTAADLRAIFSSPVFTGHLRPRAGGGEAAFWFPLIALFSGMRQSEIAGLRICDLKHDEETGRWLFGVVQYPGRPIKNVSSIREVPVHRELIRIGLLDYRDAVLERGSPRGPLWPQVSSDDKNDEGKRSGPWSKWFGRYLRNTVGIKEGVKVFHSFRHTFKRMARSAGLSEELHDALTGHAGKGGVGRSYGRGFAAQALVEAIDRIAAPETASIATVKWKELQAT